jgi:hypothetical protein
MSEIENVSLVAVGDVCIEGVKNPFAKTAHILKKADVRFCNLEGPYFDGRGTIISWTPTWSPGPSSPGGPRSGVKGLEYMVNTGFDVVQFANNHCLDFGPDAFVATLNNLEEYKIKYCGAGRNSAEARKPAIIERKDIRFAFLGYASIYKWTPNLRNKQQPGIASIRIEPFYEAPHVNKEEMEAMIDDIKSAKEKADVVIVADHWGMSGGYTLDLPQRAIGHAAIDAGADLVLGTHPHVLQGIEIYKGRIIIYSLANFVFGSWQGGFESMLLNFTFSKKGLKTAFFHPIVENELHQPEVAPPESDKFTAICKLMDKLCRELGTTLTVEKDKVWIIK